MAKRVMVLIAALAMGLVPVSRAAGQDLTLGIKFGLALDDSNYSGLPYEINNDLGATYGLRLGVQRGHFGIEVNYGHGERSLTPTPEAPPELEATSSRLNSLSFNLLYYPFPKATLQPYLTVGYAYFRVNVDGYDEDRTSGFNAGAGLNLLVLRHISLTLEARYQWVDFVLAEQPFDARTWASTLGVNYHF